MSQKYIIRWFIKPDYEKIAGFKENPYTLDELTELNNEYLLFRF